MLLENLDLIDVAIRLGTFLDHFPLVTTAEGIVKVRPADSVHLEVLPYFLSYQSNCTRQCIDDEPYDEQLEVYYRSLVDDIIEDSDEEDVIVERIELVGEEY